MRNRSLSILFAGGGTGGHLNPGIAIAQEFMARDPRNRMLFVGTDRPLETALLSKAGFRHRSITAEGMKGRGLRRQMAALCKLPRGICESVRILRSFKPDLVVGIGSYAAGPVVAAAWVLGCRIALHEQNVLPGMTNRLLAYSADRIHVSFEETAAYFHGDKVRLAGNPVRSEILRYASEALDGGQQAHGQFVVLVTGGSQGARPINQAMVDALAYLDREEGYYFIHQTGQDDEAMVTGAYRRHGVACRVQAFFDDMAEQYRSAQLVICRAGASTVAEVTAMGKPVLFIPYPFHTDNHQEINARTLREAGGADMIPQDQLSGKVLMARIRDYASHPERLARMARKAKALGKTNAAAGIVDDCYRLVGEQGDESHVSQTV